MREKYSIIAAKQFKQHRKRRGRGGCDISLGSRKGRVKENEFEETLRFLLLGSPLDAEKISNR
jgi:hypothetical protein